MQNNEMSIDYAKIESLCTKCDNDSDSINEAIKTINQQLDEVIDNNFWVGEDAEVFRAAMNEKLSQVYNAVKWINYVTYELKKHADRLREGEQARAEKFSSSMD